MLELISVTAGYQQQDSRTFDPVIEELDVEVNPGEVLAVVGNSGSGKSTLLRLVAGLIEPFSGVVARRLADRNPIWFSSQSPVLLDFRTALQNACLGREFVGGMAEPGIGSAMACLADLGLAEAANKRPHELSGGMRRRVALAQALVAHRELTLLDEPFAELDSVARQLAEITVERHRRPDGGMIIVSHDLDSVCATCDRVLILAGPPTRATSMFRLPDALTEARGPAARRASGAFADAVASLQKQIVEVG